MPFFDAHCHLQNERLQGVLRTLDCSYQSLGIEAVIVNGTSESDWVRVAEISSEKEFVIPAFGLHPWNCSTRSPSWQDHLITSWESDSNSLVGEIGLDRWITGFDIDDQLEVFLWQFREGVRRQKAITIHCLKAWGILFDVLRNEKHSSQTTFLLHSYSGSREMIAPFAKLGAYFSISGYFALDRKKNQQEILKHIPLDRVLIETDAPDMLGADRTILHPIDVDGIAVNHPSNLCAIYEFAAELFNLKIETFESIVAENFARFCSSK